MSEQTEATGLKRREFLKILGVTGAASATVGCGTEQVERLIPYVVNPDQTVPGVSTYFATTCRECSAGCGLIAETRDGRTIKLEGNPEHPVNRGALCARGQAALQGLYNPDRYRGPRLRRAEGLVDIGWDEAMRTFVQRLGEMRGRPSVFLNRHESGSFPGFLDGWLAAMGLSPHLSVDTLVSASIIAANRQSFGVAWPGLRFSAARLIVSIGADFLDAWGATVPQQLEFAEARARLADAPRFVYIGARRSLTGLNADEWIPAKPGTEHAIISALAGAQDISAAALVADVSADTLRRLREELLATRPSLVLAGVTSSGATPIALAVNAFNQTLGNVGTTMLPAQPLSGFDGAATEAELYDAVQRMRGGQVQMLMVRGANPVFTLPKSVNVAEAIARVPFKVSFGSYPDETSELCDLILPDHHPLESWGDAQAAPNVGSLLQPTMEPVFNTRATAEVLLEAQAGAAGTPTQATAAPAGGAYRAWLTSRFPGGTNAFVSALQRGITSGTVARPAARQAPTTAPEAPRLEETRGDYYFVVYPHSVLGDGSGANKPWLQELPDPVSKICWQTWIEVHPETARRLNVEAGEVLEISSADGRTVRGPAYLYPGIRRDTLAMPFGNGHTAYGRFATGVGANPLDAVPAGFERSGGFVWTSSKVSARRTGEFDQLITTEGSARQHGRGIGRAMTVDELGPREATGAERVGAVAPQGTGEHGERTAVGQTAEAHAGGHELPGDASHEHLSGLRAPVAADAQGALVDPQVNAKGMYDPAHPTGMARRRWAMTVDLARCTGCSACVTACYAENNIATVGAPHQQGHTQGLPARPGANILRSREMAWIRLERYYEGDENTADFDTRFVPMLCQHCGNAPCEPVCPVFATYHSPDGLNVQVYNRCVGTRYCSNNCPYKVRYFNWFGYGETNRPQYAWPEPLNWQLNPDVTVRGKGVMEKCTFCVQRIREAENRARLEGRELQPDEFTVACAEACPSRAITFGDAADERWSLSRLVHDRRGYHVFEELNTFTAVVYLKKVSHAPPGTARPAATPAAAH